MNRNAVMVSLLTLSLIVVLGSSNILPAAHGQLVIGLVGEWSVKGVVGESCNILTGVGCGDGTVAQFSGTMSFNREGTFDGFLAIYIPSLADPNSQGPFHGCYTFNGSAIAFYNCVTGRETIPVLYITRVYSANLFVAENTASQFIVAFSR